MSSSGECAYGGSPAVGYKLRAFRGPQGALPPASVRLDNPVNLRGGLWRPATQAPESVETIRLISGMMFDTDSDGVPDRYSCFPIGAGAISLP
jgi:hypothetical protein